MTFRKNKEESNDWNLWLNENRDRLAECDVADSLIEDRHRWLYFLEHGYYTPEGSAEPILNVDTMDRDKALKLCEFLEQDDYYPECSTLNRLQFLLKRGAHASDSPN